MNQEPGVQNNYTFDSFEQKNKQRKIKRFAVVLVIAFILFLGVRGYPYLIRGVVAFLPEDSTFFNRDGWLFVDQKPVEEEKDYKKIINAGEDLSRVEKNIQIISKEVADLEASASFDYSEELEFDVFRVKEFLNSR